MKNILKISFLIFFGYLIASCGKTEEQPVTPETAEHDDHEAENGGNLVSLTKKQLEVMQIELGAITEIDLNNTLKVNGQLELPPQNNASISALYGGRVKEVYVIEGNSVKKGQVLARLENPEFIALQQKYLSLKSNLSFLENDYKRKKSLAADGITSQKALQKAESDYLQGKADLNATRSTLKLLNINLKSLEKGDLTQSISVISPIKGYVQKVDINIGRYIQPQQEMFDIVDNEFIHIGLNVFEKDIDKVKKGQELSFSLTTKKDKVYKARIFSVGKAFEMDTRSVKVHAEIIGDHRGLLPGMFVEARIATGSKKANALPNEAFVSENGLDYIFIVKEQHDDEFEFEKIQVNKGVSDLGFSEVVLIKPLPENTKVALKGAFYINAELNKGEFEEHEH